MVINNHLNKDKNTDSKQWQLSIWLFLSVFFLGACGGGETNNQSNETILTGSNVAIYAQNITARTAQGEPIAVDLLDKVVLSKNVSFKLSQLPRLMKGADTSCQLSLLNNSQTAVAVSSEKIADCIYQYQVEATSSKSSPAKGYLRVGVGRNYSDNTLPSITKNLASITSSDIDIKAELIAQHTSVTATELADFELHESIIVLGNGNAVKNASGGIQYTPTDSSPNVTILFSLRKDNEIKLGTLLVSISDPTSGNQLPVAKNYIYPKSLVQNASGYAELANFNLVDTQDPNIPNLISDVDGDSLQLVDVQAVNSVLTIPVTPNDFTNTTFSYQTSNVGWNDVVYTVNDHNGGYAMGVISFYVEADYSIVRKWKDITINDPRINNSLTFLAPLTAAEADSLNLNYTDKEQEHDLNGSPEVMRMTYEQAESYCASRDARLPLIRELMTLNTQENDIFTNHHWPKVRAYWTTAKSANDNATAYRLSDHDIFNKGDQENVGYTDAYGANNSRYVTCVALTEGVKNFSVKTQVDPDHLVNIKSTLTTTLYDPDGYEAPFHSIILRLLTQSGTLSHQQNDGSFAAINAKGVKVYTNELGQYYSYHYDHSFNTEMINIERYKEVLEIIRIAPQELNATRLDFDSNNWIRQNFEGSYQGISNTTQYYPMNQYGLPLWRVDYLPITSDPDDPNYQLARIISLYQKPYTGKSFMGRIKIAQHGPNPPHFGRIVLSLQQVNKTDPTKMQGEWDMPGLSSQEQQMSIMVDYKDSKVMVLNKRYDPDMTEMPIDGLRQQFTYMWFIYSDTTNKLRVYLSYTDQRPKCPLSYQDGSSTKYAIDANWGTQMFYPHADNIVPDPNQYFLNLTSRIQMSDVFPTVNTAYVEYIDFVAWTDPAADVDASAITMQCEG